MIMPAWLRRLTHRRCSTCFGSATVMVMLSVDPDDDEGFKFYSLERCPGRSVAMNSGKSRDNAKVKTP